MQGEGDVGSVPPRKSASLDLWSCRGDLFHRHQNLKINTDGNNHSKNDHVLSVSGGKHFGHIFLLNPRYKSKVLVSLS